MKQQQKRVHLRDENKLKLIGERIRTIRLQKGLTQLELAHECGEKDWSQISRMERGLVNFSISYLFKIAEVLGVKPTELIDFDSE